MNDERKVTQLNVEDILPNRFQPRIKFNEDAIAELSESIKEHGVIQPIVVRQIDDKYEIIAGERRYKASLLAGKTTVPAIITDLSDKDSAEVALIENIQRKDLTPIEEAVSYKKILDMGYLTQEALADKLGKTQSTVANKLRLLNLDEEVQEYLLEEKISERHARSLLRLPMQKQSEVAKKIIAERMTVRKTDEYINQILEQKEEQPEVDKKVVPEIKGVPVKLKLEPVNETNNMNKKAELNMNETNNNMGTILPTEPIVEEIEEFIPQVPESQNPGFMDVDKIQATATDINIEKPVVDMDALLKKDSSLSQNVPVTPQIIENNSEEEGSSDEELLRPGKFFTLNDMDSPQTEVEAPSTQTPVNPLFGVPPMESTPMAQPTSNQPTFGATPTNSAQNNFDFDQFFKTTDSTSTGNQMQSSVPTVEVPPVAPQQPVNMQSPVMSEPTKIEELEIPTPNVNPTPQTTGTYFNFDFMNDGINQQISPSEQPVQTQQNIQEPMMNQMQYNETQSLASSTPNTNFMNEPMPQSQPIVNPVAPEVNQFTPVTPAATMPSMEPTPEVQPTPIFRPGAGIGTDFSTPMDNVPEPLMETPKPANTSTYVAGDLKMVINTIRDCAATIEKYGYVVDTEELDFEDTYEVTFKIEKK